MQRVPTAPSTGFRLGIPRLSRKWAPYVFISPAVILFLVFMVYPIIYSFILSFQKQNDDGDLVWSGLANYQRLLGDTKFFQALGNTVLILIVQVPIQLSLAIVLAVFLNSRLIRWRGLFRAIFFLPAVTALSAVSIVFLVLFQDTNGFVNYVLGLVGVGPIGWSRDPFWNQVLIILAITWRWTGYNMVIYLSGLQGIPRDLYEAASVDGATVFTQFFRLTLPMLRPIILFTTILSTIGTLQLFDESYLLTRGGPSDATLTVGAYLYRVAFQRADFPYASTIAYGLLVIILVLSVIQLKVGDREVD